METTTENIDLLSGDRRRQDRMQRYNRLGTAVMTLDDASVWGTSEDGLVAVTRTTSVLTFLTEWLVLVTFHSPDPATQ